MCLCLEVVCNAIWHCLCCKCCTVGSKDEKKKKKYKQSKKKNKKKMSKRDSSKTVGSSKEPKMEPPVGNLKRLSELCEEELLAKYMIVLPKDNCYDPVRWLRTKGYELTTDELGSGGFGKVNKAIKHEDNGTKLDIAVKVIEMNPDSSKYLKRRNSLKNELFISDALIRQISKVKHDHIIKIFDRFVIDYQGTGRPLCSAYIFMELAEGDLSSELKKTGPLPQDLAKRYFSQIVYAMDYMHRLNIAHRDLKLDNFLLVKSATVENQKDIKVSDFGLSRVDYTEKSGTILSSKVSGTRPYKSPEILRIQDMGGTKQFDPFKADIWALGICLYQMLTNRWPFTESEMKGIIVNNKRKELVYVSADDKQIVIDKSGKDLLERLLAPDPDNRPKIHDVKCCKWLEGVNTITLSQTTP